MKKFLGKIHTGHNWIKKKKFISGESEEGEGIKVDPRIVIKVVEVSYRQ